MQPLLQQLDDASKRTAEALQRCQSGGGVILAARPLVPASGDWADLELCSDEELSHADMTLQLMLRQAAQAPAAGSLFAPAQSSAASAPAQDALRAALKAVKDYQALTKVGVGRG